MSSATKAIVRTAVLPGIIPRLRLFFGSGFAFLSAMIASVFYMARLLPPGHPYLNPTNFGRFGIRHVLFEARKNLVFKWSHADQVLIFFLVLSGIVMLGAQFILLILSFTVPHAEAAGVGAYFASFFVTAAPNNDIAFMTLDRVFGVPNLFNSKINSGFDGTFPSPFHDALHLMLSFYSTGVFIIGIILVIYFTIALTGETAASGVPFGKRFNPWFGIRFILALAALAPIYMGMGMGQLMTLRMAKWGSSVATNGWIAFNNKLVGTTLAGDPNELVSIPNEPDANTLLSFMSVVHSCVVAEDKMHNRTIDAFIVKKGAAAVKLTATSFNAAMNAAENMLITIRFGVEDDEAYKLEISHVSPICGELNIPVIDEEEPGALKLQEDYYNIVRDLWTDGLLTNFSLNLGRRMLPTADKQPMAVLPGQPFFNTMTQLYESDIKAAIQAAVNAEIAGGQWMANVTDRGWAGAAIWYNKIAQLNGGLIASARNLPTPSLYPAVMEYVAQQKKAQNDHMSFVDRYNPYYSDGQMVKFPMAGDYYIATMLQATQGYWQPQMKVKPSGNMLIDMINMLLGTQGIYDMVENTNVHPLAQVVAVGRGLIESSVINLGFSAGGAIVGALSGATNRGLTEAAGKAVSKVAGKFAMIGFTLGFILYYVVPFMPFMYFFFAFGGWVKSLFEAIVGIPLWALSLLRIDGDGLFGPSPMNGIWLVFEIFLRPVLIISGLIAAVTIFTAMVRVLNETWSLVITNLSGHDITTKTKTGTGSIDFYRGPIDEFFYTILYTIIVYLIGTSCFKLIDSIPNQILRWMGQGVATFQENAGDPADNLVSQMFIGGQAIIGQSSGAFAGLLGRNG